MVMHRARPAIGADREITASVTGRARLVSAAFVNEPSIFVSPSPSPAEIDDQIAIVDDAETLASGRGRGAAAARNVARNVLWGLLEVGKTYVQGVADRASSVDQAIVIIERSGFVVAQTGQRQKPILKAARGQVPNSVALFANLKALTGGTRKRFFVCWQLTGDGGKSFVDLPSTPKGRTTVLDLTPLTTYGFRVAYTNSDGVRQEWSPLVSYLMV